jgi:hypothetical protein
MLAGATEFEFTRQHAAPLIGAVKTTFMNRANSRFVECYYRGESYDTEPTKRSVNQVCKTVGSPASFIFTPISKR